MSAKKALDHYEQEQRASLEADLTRREAEWSEDFSIRVREADAEIDLRTQEVKQAEEDLGLRLKALDAAQVGRNRDSFHL